MFENLLGQEQIKNLLSTDIAEAKLPHSILFLGSAGSGKLTAALETARAVSCTQGGKWDCMCSSCLKHKELISPDLLLMGSRDNSLEIKAAAEALLKNKTTAVRYLFLRAVRKLTSKFDERMWDSDETRFVKAATLICEISENLADLATVPIENFDFDKLNKLIENVVKKTGKLQEECMYDSIPINQVRKISSWIRLMPSGKRKIMIAENADKMQEGARNAFLKILEEPPPYALFILTASRKGAVMPTILSRLRPYPFAQRSNEIQIEVIQRVFRGEYVGRAESFNPLTEYLYKYLPVDFKRIKDLSAVFFEYSLGGIEGRGFIPKVLLEVIRTHIEENNTGIETSVEAVFTALNKCKPNTVFELFLSCLLSFLRQSMHTGKCTALELKMYSRITELVHSAQTSVNIFNMPAQAVMENLAQSIKELRQP